VIWERIKNLFRRDSPVSPPAVYDEEVVKDMFDLEGFTRFREEELKNPRVFPEKRVPVHVEKFKDIIDRLHGKDGDGK
jgi:hypothetical protein